MIATPQRSPAGRLEPVGGARGQRAGGVVRIAQLRAEAPRLLEVVRDLAGDASPSLPASSSTSRDFPTPAAPRTVTR